MAFCRESLKKTVKTFGRLSPSSFAEPELPKDVEAALDPAAREPSCNFWSGWRVGGARLRWYW